MSETSERSAKSRSVSPGHTELTGTAELGPMDAMKAEIDAWKSAAITRWAEAVSNMAVEQELRSRLRAWERDLQQLTVRLQSAEAEVGELKKQIDGLRSSTSWRLTSPIRRATRAIRQTRERM